jgi:hypothetical protein
MWYAEGCHHSWLLKRRTLLSLLLTWDSGTFSGRTIVSFCAQVGDRWSLPDLDRFKTPLSASASGTPLLRPKLQGARGTTRESLCRAGNRHRESCMLCNYDRVYGSPERWESRPRHMYTASLALPPARPGSLPFGLTPPSTCTLAVPVLTSFPAPLTVPLE